MATLGETSRPAYVYDSGTDTWIPVGIGPHSHDPSAINAVASTTFDAKGDLLAGTGADTYSKLTVGTNGLALVADSTTSTGLKYGTPSFIGCRVYASAVQSINNATATALNWNTENFDTNTFHDNSTNNSRITIPSGYGGKYRIKANANIQSNATGYRLIILYKNGTATYYNFYDSSDSEVTAISIDTIMDLAATDYVQVYVQQNSGGALNADTTTFYGWFEAHYLGA